MSRTPLVAFDSVTYWCLYLCAMVVETTVSEHLRVGRRLKGG